MIAEIFVMLFAALFQNISSYNTQTVNGYSRYHGWMYTSIELSTFIIYHYENISNRDVTINTAIMEQIEGLSMKSNKNIAFLPIKVYQNFPNLLGYNAQNCAINEITYANFKNLNELQALILSENKIVFIHSNTFNDLHKLQDLMLDGNNLNLIGSQTFKTLSNLQFLQLDNNEISFLSVYLLKNSRKLEKLSLAGNNLTKLTDDHFSNNSMLTKIWLEHNNIKSLSYTMFNHMNNLKYVNFKNNACIDGHYFDETFEEMKEVIKKYCSN